LISWNGFPAGVRDNLSAYDFGSATLGIKDDTFASHLQKARPTYGDLGQCQKQCADKIFDFDPGLDEGSPGSTCLSSIKKKKKEARRCFENTQILDTPKTSSQLLSFK
jgi:hypothetical protein